MEMWQWILLFSAVSINTIVNCLRLHLERKINDGKKLR
jgi:hypothetical protein